MITLCDIMSLRGCLLEAISEEDWLIYPTDAYRDNNVSIGKMTSPNYVILHSRPQQVRTKQRLSFTSWTLFMP